jgi:hypothetical protein
MSIVQDELGEIFYGDGGQVHRIRNLDESCVMLDNTEQDRGRRPAMSFYDPYLQEAPQLPAHKNSYRASGMYGCTMGGYTTPVHFILPTNAKEENQGIGIEFIQDMKSVAFSHFMPTECFTDLDSDFIAEQEMDFSLLHLE